MASLKDPEEDEQPPTKKLKGSGSDVWKGVDREVAEYYKDLCDSDRAEGEGFFKINFLPGERRVPSCPILPTTGRLARDSKSQGPEPKTSWMCVEHSQGCRCIEQAQAQAELEARMVAIGGRLDRLRAALETAPDANNQVAAAGDADSQIAVAGDADGQIALAGDADSQIALAGDADSQVALAGSLPPVASHALEDSQDIAG